MSRLHLSSVSYPGAFCRHVTGFENLTVLCSAKKQGYFCVPKDLIMELPAETAIVVAF